MYFLPFSISNCNLSGSLLVPAIALIAMTLSISRLKSRNTTRCGYFSFFYNMLLLDLCNFSGTFLFCLFNFLYQLQGGFIFPKSFYFTPCSTAKLLWFWITWSRFFAWTTWVISLVVCLSAAMDLLSSSIFHLIGHSCLPCLSSLISWFPPGLFLIPPKLSAPTSFFLGWGGGRVWSWRTNNCCCLSLRLCFH